MRIKELIKINCYFNLVPPVALHGRVPLQSYLLSPPYFQGGASKPNNRMSLLGGALIVTFIILFAPIAQAAEVFAPDFHYSKNDANNRTYYYSNNNQVFFENYIETFSVDQPKLGFLVNNPDFFISPLSVWENKQFTLIRSPKFNEILLNKKTLIPIKNYILRQKNAQMLELIFPGGSNYSLNNASISVNASVTITGNKMTKETKINGMKFVYEFTRTIDQLPTSDPPKIAGLFEPEFCVEYWQGIINTRNVIFQKTNLNNYYTFLKLPGIYIQTNQYPVFKISGSSGKLFTKNNNQTISLDSLPMTLLHPYYYIKEKDDNKTKSITDTEILSLQFPETSAPQIDSDIISSTGQVSVSRIIAQREEEFSSQALASANCLDYPANYTYGYVTVNNSPFPHASRSSGNVYSEQFYSADKNYSDSSIAFYIPSYFDINKDFHYLVYLHGWNNSITNVLRTERLTEQIEASKKNIILIIPELAKDAPDTSGGNLDERDGFKNMMQEIFGRLARSLNLPRAKLNKGKIIVAAHSGGYSPLANILMYGGEPIERAFLFDGLYWHRDRFLLWKEHNPLSRLVILYTDSGGTTREVQQLAKTIRGYQLSQSLGELDLPDTQESPSISAVIKNSEILLINTGNTSHHNILSKGYLELLLKNL